MNKPGNNNPLPLKYEESVNLIESAKNGVSGEIDFILVLGKIIDDLLLETEFSDDFFKKFDYYASTIDKTDNKTLFIIFDELHHNFQGRNIKGIIFKNNEERVIRYKKILNDLKYNIISESKDIEEISNGIIKAHNNADNGYVGLNIELENSGSRSGKINEFFLNMVLDNILSNYRRYGKNGTLKIIFGDNNFDIEFTNEIKQFDTQVYDKFKRDFPGDTDNDFFKKINNSIKNIDGFEKWFQEKGDATDNYENDEVFIPILEEFYDKFFVNYNGNVNFLKKDLINMYYECKPQMVKSYEIFLDAIKKSGRKNPNNFLMMFLPRALSYIFYYGNKPTGTGKGNGIISKVVKDLFGGEIFIESDEKNYSVKLVGLKYE